MLIQKVIQKIRPDDKTEQAEKISCPICGKSLLRNDVVINNYICTECGSYFRVRTKNRIRMVADSKTFEPWFEDMKASNPLEFPGYEEKVTAAQEKTGLREAVTIGFCRIFGKKAVLGVCDSRFLMSSMGHVMGEKITKAVERATDQKLPVILFCCSGGARMQEGMVSLMQMAKTSAAIKRHSEAGLLYMPILTDPTTGGVTASFAMLGDVILAEPGALIGFAGPRVIEQTIGQKLPKGFQRAEFLLEHGMIDGIVERDDLKKTIYRLLKMHENKDELDEFGDTYQVRETDKERQVKSAQKNAWDKVKSARKLTRPTALELITAMFDDFVELHGDRLMRDDPAIVGGIAFAFGKPITVIGVQKGKDAGECEKRNFGMPSPEGYRKALRLMKQAEKFGRPIITLINCSGAYPGIEAEEHGQGEAIARNLFEMSSLKVPVLAIVTGEGGSGGALALAVGNEVWMMENATYSILSPEGFASILWKDGARAKEAAEIMGITAEQLKRNAVIDKIIPEYGEANAETLEAIAMYIKENLYYFLKKYENITGKEIAEQRYKRFQKY